MRRAVAALGILMTLAWGPASSLLCISQRTDDNSSAHLVLATQSSTSSSKLNKHAKNAPAPKTQDKSSERVLQAVSESLDTAPSVHFEVAAFAAKLVAVVFCETVAAAVPVYPDVAHGDASPPSSNASSRAPPHA